MEKPANGQVRELPFAKIEPDRRSRSDRCWLPRRKEGAAEISKAPA